MQEKSVFCSGLLLYIFPLYAHRKGAFIQNHQQDRFLQTGKIFLFHICNAGKLLFIFSAIHCGKNAGFLKRCPAAALGLSVVLTILFGAGIYYLVERPMQTAGKKLIFPAVCKFRCNFYQLVGSCFERKFFMYQSLLFKDCLRYLGIVIFYVMNAVFEILSGMIIQDSGWE